MTPFGFMFLFSALFGVWLGIAVIRKMRRKKGRVDWGSRILIVAIYLSISLLFFPFLYFAISWAHSVATFPRFEATVISYDSSWEEVTRTDSDGDSYTVDVLMHRPTVSFVDGSGETVTIATDVRSGSEPVIGSTRTVAYQDGKVLEISLASVGLRAGLALMLLILGYVMTHAIYYITDRDDGGLYNVGVGFLMYAIIPLSMLGMFAGMIYGIMDFLSGTSDMPLVIFIVCCFFALVLFLSFIGYLMMLFSGKQKPRRQKAVRRKRS